MSEPTPKPGQFPSTASLRISVAMEEELEKVALATDRKPSDIMRQAIREYLEAQKHVRQY